MRFIGGLLVLLSLAVPALAGDKKASFDGTLHDVFSAAVKTVAKNWAVTHADEKAGVLTFTTGTSATTWGMDCSAIFEEKNGKVTVTVHTQKKNQVFAWGAGDRIADKLFKGIRQELSGGPKGDTALLTSAPHSGVPGPCPRPIISLAKGAPKTPELCFFRFESQV